MYLYFFPALSIMSAEGYDFCVYFDVAVCIKEVCLNTEKNLFYSNDQKCVRAETIPVSNFGNSFEAADNSADLNTRLLNILKCSDLLNFNLRIFLKASVLQ